MTQWTEAPQGVSAPPIFKTLEDVKVYAKYLADILAITTRDLEYIINGQIDAKNIRADSIITRNLQAGAVTADKINVTELSAITANMGTLTAGSITTNAEINIGTDATVGNNLHIGQPLSTSDKYIYLNDATISSPFGGDSLLLGTTGLINITNIFDSIILTTNDNVSVNSQNGSILDIVGSINSLASSISSLNTSITSLNSSVSSLSSSKADHGSTSSTSVSDGHNHGIPNGTQLLDADGVTTHTWVTYAGSPSHSHTV